MKRSEFTEREWDFSDLKDFCYDNDCSVMDCVYSDSDYSSVIDDLIYDKVRRDSWEDIRDTLDNLPSGYEYYEETDWEWKGLYDDDVEEFVSDVLDWGDRNGIWEPEEDESEDESEADEEPEEEEDLEEDVPLMTLIFTDASDLSEASCEDEDDEEETLIDIWN